MHMVLTKIVVLNSYVTNRKQRKKINSRYISYSKVLFGVPQGSSLVPFLFNSSRCDMFHFLEDFDTPNYVDNPIPYNAAKRIEFVVNNLDQSSSSIFRSQPAIT